MREIRKMGSSMLVYHGSNSNFRTLKINRGLCRTKEENLREGMGIYFSTYREVAEAYGKYLYTLEINSKNLINFNNKRTCYRYVDMLMEDVYLKYKIDLRNLSTYESIINGVHGENIMICKLGNELALELDNDYNMYQRYLSGLSDRKHDEIMAYIRKLDKKYLKAYMYTCSDIKGVGVIKDVDSSVVRIVDKVKLH